MKPLLLHVCCGPCAIMPVELLSSEFDVHGYWYNPNIHPYEEYEKRMQAAGFVFQRLGMQMEWDLSYDIAHWFADITGEMKQGRNRCAQCYRIRLMRTAECARRLEIGCFTTTMLQSPHQDIALIEAAGREGEEATGVRFIMRDFRDSYKQGKSRTRQWGVYHQYYCGCLFSEVERRGLPHGTI